jgi:hypothetical protein
MEVKAEVKSIAKLKDYFFLVPDYQREYVWKPDDQVEQFIIDIDNEYDPHAKEQKSYFLGSIIIVENKGRYDVIDGQQRLTTIILALCAFRDLLDATNLDETQKNHLKTIVEILSNFDPETEEVNVRLELQYEESKDYLQKRIQNQEFTEIRTSSIIKMELAYEKLKAHFGTYLKLGVDKLVSYARYFQTKIELVLIESKNLSSALKIFETINQRGSGLNAMDLVKNLLFSKASESDFQKIKETWKEITTNLQLCKEDNSPLRFLRYFLMARYHNGIIREDDIYKWIISPEGKMSMNYESEPLKFAKEVKAISKRYSDLVLATELMKEGGGFPNVTNIGFVNKYKSRQHLILLLALDANVGIDIIEYLAAQIESFFFFSNTLGIQAKNNEGLFASWAGKLRGLKTKDEIKGFVDASMAPYIKEKLPQFKSDFLNIRHDAYFPLYRLRYVLGSIENSILLKCGMSLKGKSYFDTLQVEHILPQTAKGGILNDEFKDMDDYLSHVQKLGNVTLLESIINQAVNNYNDLKSDWFQKKQDEYVKSDITSTKLLNDKYSIGNDTGLNRFKADCNYIFDNWDKKAINDRQEILLELVFDTWRFNDKRIDKL